jgi:beta-glucanase (GH16 family)
MMPKYSIHGNWPHSGEIDIFEWVGYDPTHLYSSALMAGKTSGEVTSRGIALIDDDEPEFHTIAFEWTADSLRWFFDGVHYHSYHKSESNGEARLWPFDSEFYLILNYAYGGAWGGQQGVDDSKLPQEFVIDYVRVYQKSAQSAIRKTKRTPLSVKLVDKDKLMITAPFSSFTVDIFSSFGTGLLTQKSNTQEMEISIASLPKGIYIARASDDMEQYSEKFIKE